MTEDKAGSPGSWVVAVTFGGETREIAYRDGDTVLQTARRGGFDPPYSCEAGNCATCIGRILEGSVVMRENEALDPEDLEEGFILTCQSVPQTAQTAVKYGF